MLASVADSAANMAAATGGENGKGTHHATGGWEVGRLLLEGALVGLVAGAVITIFRLLLSAAESALRFITESAAGNPLLIAGWFAILIVVLIVVTKLMAWEPDTSGSGIPQVLAELDGKLDMSWKRVIPAKMAEGTLCAFAGLSLGREGPSVQLGAMSGKVVAETLDRDEDEEHILVTSGASAGMAAAFNAPLAGALFAVEEVRGGFSAPLIVSVLSASAVADLLASEVFGLEPVITFELAEELGLSELWLVVILGLICGLLGVLHNKGMFLSQDLLGRLGSPTARLAIAFALAGVAAFVFPELMCGGDAILELLEEPETLAIGLVAALLIGKFVMTAVSFGSGAPGGTLLPLVVMGALTGALFGLYANAVGGVSAEFISNFMVLGIAGLFASVVQAPLTGIVLACELTGSAGSLLPLVLVSLLSYAVAGMLKAEPFYEHLLEGLLAKQEPASARS